MNTQPTLDAAGRIPTPRTAKEEQWSETVRSGRIKGLMDTLTERRALPLDAKIEMSLARIRDWHEAWDGAVSVSYSGGKDSSVLLWLVRQLYPDVPAVFCHTGLEYPEVVRLVMDTPNHVILRPKMRFSEVITKYGWPIASKKIARGISILRNPTDRNQNIYRLYDQGINRFGCQVNGRRVSQCWRFLVHAPFSVSDKCCAVMKKDPIPRAVTWTTEPPKISGQYWWKCEQEQPDNPQMVRVVMTNEQYSLFFHYSEGPIFHSCDKCQWAGPIPAPKEPA